MSILIKGMKMPTNCFLCPLSVLNENRLFCEVTKNEVLRAKIDAGCPLVPVQPHGDLIDRDALKDKAEFIGDAFSGRGGYAVWGTDVINAPVVIPAERIEE